MDDDDPEKRIRELERQLGQYDAGQSSAASMPPQSGWPQASQPQPGYSPQPQTYPSAGPGPQPFPPPPPVGPVGDQFGSWPSPSAGWPGAPQFGGKPKRRGRYLWILVVPFLLLWPIVKYPVMGLVQRTVDHENTANPNTAGQRTGPARACDVFTLDIAKPVLGGDAHVTQNMSAICGYQSSRGTGSIQISDWASTKPSGPDQRPVPGLGDEAVFYADDLYVRKGERGVRITLSQDLFTGTGSDSEAQRDDAEKSIAQQLLPKL